MNYSDSKYVSSQRKHGLHQRAAIQESNVMVDVRILRREETMRL